MNRTILTGRLTKEPQIRYTPNGVAVATFTLAVNRPFANQQGERETDYINIVVWRKQAENVANYLKKGSQVGVDGRLQTRNYDGKDGKKVYVTEVLAESVDFLEPRSNSNQGQQQLSSGNSSNQGVQPQNNTFNDDPFANVGQPVEFSDNDLPF